MEIRHLKYFLAAAEEENLHRAADRLGITVPALSRRIYDLETSMGVKLFERRQKRLRLSSSGQSFRRDIERILRDIELAGARSRRLARSEAGTLCLGVFPYVLQYPAVSNAIRAYNLLHGIDLTVSSKKHSVIVDAILDRQVDAAFLYNRPDDDEVFDHQEVLNDTFLLALPAHHPLTAQKEIFLKDLSGYEFLWMSRGYARVVSDRLMSACQAGGLAPKVLQKVDSESARVSLVAAGLGIAFVGSSFSDYDPADVALRKVADLKLSLNLSLIWRRDNRIAAVDEFLRTIETQFHPVRKPTRRATTR